MKLLVLLEIQAVENLLDNNNTDSASLVLNEINYSDLMVPVKNGVRNVLDRIHLFYGEDYGISVETVTGQKTSVEIRVPVLEDDREGGGEA